MIGTSNTLKVEQDQSRVKQLQRRIIRLLLQHDSLFFAAWRILAVV
jgi:hypothetical protein